MRNDGFHDRQDALDRLDRARKTLGADLLALIARAIPIIETERQGLFDGHQVNGVLKIDPDDEGDVTAKETIDEMDSWLEAARKAVA